MSINLSYYDITQFDYHDDSTKDGLIPQSAANSWIPLAPAFKRIDPKLGENRVKHFGNSQTLTINKRAKRWLDWSFELLALKYDSTSPAYDFWDLVSKCFYGGATGAPTSRPGSVLFGLKYNRTTPEYWTAADAKALDFTLRGNMVQDHLSFLMTGLARLQRFDTNNYVQGTATRRANPTLDPIVPSKDTTFLIDGADETKFVQTFSLIMRRTYERSGRADTVAGSSSQIAVDGLNFRELVPNTFEARLELELDPYGTDSARIIDYFNDTAQSTFEIKTQQETGGKKIQFTASKQEGADQPHQEAVSPSRISLTVEGSTINVATV